MIIQHSGRASHARALANSVLICPFHFLGLAAQSLASKAAEESSGASQTHSHMDTPLPSFQIVFGTSFIRPRRSFLNKVTALAEANYTPTDEDILKVRDPTRSIETLDFKVGKAKFRCATRPLRDLLRRRLLFDSEAWLSKPLIRADFAVAVSR